MWGTSPVRTILSVAIAMVFVVYTTDLLILICDLKPSRKTRSGAYRTQLSFASLHFESLFFSVRNITWRTPFSKTFHFWRDAAVVCDDLSYRSNSNYSKLYSSLRQTFIEAAHGSWLCEWSGREKLCTCILNRFWSHNTWGEQYWRKSRLLCCLSHDVWCTSLL